MSLMTNPSDRTPESLIGTGVLDGSSKRTLPGIRRTGSVNATCGNIVTVMPAAPALGAVLAVITPGGSSGRLSTPPPAPTTRNVYDTVTGEPDSGRAVAVTVYE